MAPRTVYANLQDGLQPFTLWDGSLADMGKLGITPCTASGTNSIVLTPIASAFAPNVTSPNQFQSFAFVAAGASTGPVTIQNGTDAALKLYRPDGITQAGSGDISTGVIYEIKKNTALNSGAGGYQISSPAVGFVQSVINDTNVTGSVAGTTLTLGWTGTLAAGRLNANVVQGVTNDTNIQGSVSAQNLTFSWAGQLAVTRGGTGLATVAQGDLLYGSALNTIASLAKNASATRYLANTGASNAPNWDQVNLANGVTGNLPVTNLNSGTSASAATFWRGDGTWSTPAGAGTVTSSGPPVVGQIPRFTTATDITGVVWSVTPQGRVTLTTAVPVLTSTVSGATTVYYTPYVGQLVPIYDGTTMIPTVFTELSQLTTDATKSPAAVAASKVYDLFVWNDSGTLRCTRGPAWTNDTTRGYTLTMQNGILLNTSAITNGPGASRGTYVGTIRSNGSSTIDFILGGSSAGGTAAFLGVWNTYNRVNVRALVQDSTVSSSYSTATWRAADASTGNRVSFVIGLQEDQVDCRYAGIPQPSTNIAIGHIGIGLDVTNALASAATDAYIFLAVANGLAATCSNYSDYLFGFHFLQAIENTNANAVTFNYNNGQAALIANLRM